MPSCIGPLRMQETTALFIAWASKSMDMLSHWFLDLACGHFRTITQQGAQAEGMVAKYCMWFAGGWREWLAECECRTKGSPKYDSILHCINPSLSCHPLCLGLCASCNAHQTFLKKNATFAPTGPPSETSWHKAMLRTKNVWESNWSCDDGFWGTTPLGTSSGCSLVVMLLATCFRPESLRFNTAAFNKKVDVEVSYKAISPN